MADRDFYKRVEETGKEKGVLDEKLDEELGYSKYDYPNKETDNSRNGHSSKTLDITKKWTGCRQDWGQIRSQLEIFFKERL